MFRTLVLATLALTLALPAAVSASPPIGSWDHDGESAPPAPGDASPPSRAQRTHGIGVQPHRRPVIRRRRGKIDFSSLRARNYGQKITIGVFTGMKIFSSNAQLGNTRDTSVHAKSGLALGLRTGYNITHYVGIQGEASYTPSSYFDGGHIAHLFGFRGFIMLHLPWGALRPFLLLGGGVEVLPIPVDGIAIDYDGAFIAGLGTKYDLNDSVSLRFDVRGISTDGVVGGAINWEALVGLTFRFMGR